MDSFLFWPIAFLNDPKEIRKKEQLYINVLKPQFNSTTNVDKPLLGRKLNEKQREAIRKASLGRVPWNKGIPFSDDVKAKMSRNGKGKGKGKVRPKKISTREVCRDDGVVFKNAEAAATELGVRTNTIIKAISDENICRKVKGFEFCYLDDFGFSKPKEKSPTWGVHVNGKEFIARFRFEGQKVYLGRFKTKEQAIKARDTYLQNAKSAKEKSEINSI